jgi:hypothetical protein
MPRWTRNLHRQIKQRFRYRTSRPNFHEVSVVVVLDHAYRDSVQDFGPQCRSIRRALPIEAGVDVRPFLVIDVEDFDAGAQRLIEAGVELNLTQSQSEREHRPEARDACGE